ncbi:MAG TPA: DUF1801 domain-containing protein [Bacteroidales bacterium]|jgi:uncharacterized protein YdhG (YjbR/CyaY superfamily)|nr:DUF1801 domain-containing protein [Bacteroidales bacterium]
MKKQAGINTVDEYISSFPEERQKILKKLRDIIRKSAPEAEEKISYQMAAFAYKGILVYFAAQAHHIGFYPGTEAVEVFKEDLVPYETSKGTVRFSYEEPLPLNLISQIVKFRVIANSEKEMLRKLKK